MSKAAVIDQTTAEIDAALREAMRDGLRQAFLGRTAVLALVCAWLAYNTIWYGTTTLVGLIIALAYLVLGLLMLRVIGKAWELPAVYAFVAVEIAAIGVFAATLPLAASGGVPQIFLFRVYNIAFLLLPVAGLALTLSPALVLWAGAMACATLWAVFGWIVSGMERTLSWQDFPAGGPGADYVAIVLSPHFIGLGNRIEETIIMASVTGLIAYGVYRARGFVRARATTEARRLRTIETFGQYVPPELVERLVSNAGGLEPRAVQGSILFADIAGFTTFSETRQPATVIRAMTGIFDLATEAVMANDGIVAGFAGDALIAAFTAPGGSAASAAAALRAARNIRQTLAGKRFDGTELRLRIGIASGPFAAGSVGGGRRRAYTVYGDTVNLSQRLQEIGKGAGCSLILCSTTWRLAGEPEGFVDLGGQNIRGRDGSVSIRAEA